MKDLEVKTAGVEAGVGLLFHVAFMCNLLPSHILIDLVYDLALVHDRPFSQAWEALGSLGVCPGKGLWNPSLSVSFCFLAWNEQFTSETLLPLSVCSGPDLGLEFPEP
jgi:hypothetical protein